MVSLRRRKALLATGLAIVIVLVVATQSGWLNKSAKQVEISQPGLYTIDHYIDGDTIAVNMNGSVETIRFIGVDTPETHKPNTPVQCYGELAAANTKTLIQTGFGFAYLGFPFSKADQFAADEAVAQTAKAGLWGACKPEMNQYGGYTSNPA